MLRAVTTTRRESKKPRRAFFITNALKKKRNGVFFKNCPQVVFVNVLSSALGQVVMSRVLLCFEVKSNSVGSFLCCCVA